MCGCVPEGVVAVRETVRAFAGFATFGHAHIRGLAQDLCSSHLRRLKSSAPTRGRVLRRRIAELCARAGTCSDRLANRNGLSVSVSVSQRELVSLVRVVGVGVGSGLVVVQVAISQQ